jgi:hypothetical protein
VADCHLARSAVIDPEQPYGLPLGSVSTAFKNGHSGSLTRRRNRRWQADSTRFRGTQRLETFLADTFYRRAGSVDFIAEHA